MRALMMTSMNFRNLTSVVLLTLLGGCQEKNTSPQAERSPITEEQPSPEERQPAPKTVSRNFGQSIDLRELTPLDAIFSSPAEYDGKTVLLEGFVQRACSKKGCWMEIAIDENPEAQRCRVKFKDYAFFVPRDSAGSQAKVQGVVQVNTVKKERVDHLEAEGARFAHKRADGTALEVQVVATGVNLKKDS